MMKDVYAGIVKGLEEKVKMVLATLITRVGSAPREVGAKYLVREDGNALGSIGGGCVEAEVWQGARRVMERGEGGVLHFHLTAEQLAEGGLICGGKVDIFLEPIQEEFLNIYREVVGIRKGGVSGILVTVISVEGDFPGREGVKMLLKPSGEKVGHLFVGDELDSRILEKAEELFKEKKPKVLAFRSEKADSLWREMEILLEPISSEPTLYIFGAGHVSQQLAPFAQRVQFKVVVIDDREMFANRERFPEADEVIVSEFKDCFDRLPIDGSSYIVILTRGHLYDGEVLEKAVQTSARYIGMIGSKKKIRLLYRDLLKKGIPKESLDRVHAPIGIDIHSETPEEIAVSIVAELIKVRREKLA